MSETKQMSILIVDDREDNLELIKIILQDEGYSNLHTSSTVADCYDILESTPIDLILMDVMMPETDGLSGCKVIKEREEWKDIPLIIVTAKSDNETLKMSFDCKATDYIRKPVNETELIVRVKSALISKQDLDYRKSRENELTEASITDPLTGLFNRRYMDIVLEKELLRTKREKDHLSLILADIDFFKQYNDNYGHQAGDEVLKKVAQVMKKSFKRQGDFAARFGGEEFVAFFTGLNEARSTDYANLIKNNIENLHIEHSKSHVSNVITLSIGLTVLSGDINTDSEEIIKRADDALYKAKREGRNRVVLWRPVNAQPYLQSLDK